MLRYIIQYKLLIVDFNELESNSRHMTVASHRKGGGCGQTLWMEGVARGRGKEE